MTEQNSLLAIEVNSRVEVAYPSGPVYGVVTSTDPATVFPLIERDDNNPAIVVTLHSGTVAIVPLTWVKLRPNCKRYQLSYANLYEVVIEVDHDIMTEAQFLEVNSFWADAEARLQQVNGCAVSAVLQMLCTEFHLQATELLSPIRSFELPEPSNVEGMRALDGTAGIYLVYWDFFRFDRAMAEIKEIAL